MSKTKEEIITNKFLKTAKACKVTADELAAALHYAAHRLQEPPLQPSRPRKPSKPIKRNKTKEKWK